MKIDLSKIKGYFPDGYSEQKYIDSSVFRVKRDGNDITILRTPLKLRVKNDNSYRNRKVQTVFYDKYLLSFIITESTNTDLLTIADKVVITLDSGEIHNAELLDVPTYENVQNSDFKRVTLSYRDLDSKRTINHLEVSDLTDGIASFSSGLTTVYTPLYCDFDVTEYERSESTDTDVPTVSKDNAFRIIKFYGYVTDAQLETIKRGLSAAYDFSVVFNGTTYTEMFYPEIEVEEGEYEGIKGITVIVHYEQILNYPYIESQLSEITLESNINELQFDYSGSDVLSVLITTNSPSGWNITNVSDSWITAFKSGDSLKVSVHESLIDRTGSIEISSADDNTVNLTITVIQDETSISANPIALNFELIDESTKTSIITTDIIGNWEIKSISNSWIKANKVSNNLEVEVLASPISVGSRDGSVTVNVIGDETKTATIYIYQGIAT